MKLSIKQGSDRIGRYTFSEFNDGFDVTTYVEVQEPKEDFVLNSYNKTISECPYSFLGFGITYSSFTLLNKIHFFNPRTISVIHINKEEYERMKELKMDLFKFDMYRDVALSHYYIKVLEPEIDIEH